METPTNFSCGVWPINIVGPQCSGNGGCFYDSASRSGVCLCKPGWKGESDFQVTNSLLDCQINVVAIQVLWGLFLVFHIVSYVRYLPKLRWLWKKHLVIVDRNKANGKRYTLWDNKGLLSFAPYVTFGWWSQLIYGIAKIADQDFKIGQSVWLTILYLIWRTTFFFAPNSTCFVAQLSISELTYSRTAFQPALVESLLRSQRNLDHLISRNRLLSQISLSIAFLLGIPSIIPMVVPQDPLNPMVGIVSMAVLLVGASLSMLFLVCQAIYIERKVQATLGLSYELSKEPRTKAIMDKMRSNQQQIMFNGSIQFLIYGLFGLVTCGWTPERRSLT
jgi:hypothetical protein